MPKAEYTVGCAEQPDGLWCAVVFDVPPDFPFGDGDDVSYSILATNFDTAQAALAAASLIMNVDHDDA